MDRHRIQLWAVVVLLSASITSVAQAAPQNTDKPSPAPGFTSGTELVMVPTVVTGHDNQAVRGLKREDFSIKENGKAQEIAVFEEVTAAPVPAIQRQMPVKPGAFTNVPQGTTAGAPPRATIVVFDLINTDILDLEYGRKQWLEFLDKTVDNTGPIALLRMDMGGIQVIHDFTTDSGVLLAAVRGLRGGNRNPGETTDLSAGLEWARGREGAGGFEAEAAKLVTMLDKSEEQYAEVDWLTRVHKTLDCWRAIAEAYRVVPGRKAFVWVSGGFIFNPEGLKASPTLYEKYMNTWQAMTDANLAMYTIDARGLVNPDFKYGIYAASSPPPSVAQIRGGFQTQPAQAQSALSSSWVHSDILQTMKVFADQTGGRAIYGTNDLVGGFRRAMNDSDHYYMLGFYRNRQDSKPGWRKLTVSVQASGAQVRARTGYYVRTAGAEAALRENDIKMAVNTPLEMTAIPLTARFGAVTPGAKPGEKRVAFELVMPPNFAQVDEEKNSYVLLDFAAVAVPEKEASTGKAKIVDQTRQTLEANLRPEPLARFRAQGMTYPNSLNLPPGKYTVRFVVRDGLTGRMGSVTAPLKVE